MAKIGRDNLVCACHGCNQQKDNQTAVEFGYAKVQEQVKKSLKAAAHTQAGKTATLEGLSKIAPVRETYGYITKVNRQALGLPKAHHLDAAVIASQGQPIEMLSWHEIMKAVSRGSRQQRKGRHSQMVARLPYEVSGFRMWDKVELPDGSIGFIGARRKSGSFTIKNIAGEIIKVITFRKLRLIERASTLPAFKMF